MTAFEVPREDLVTALLGRAWGPPFLLSGPPGAGKTWLLRALAERLRAQGALPITLDLFTAASSADRFVVATLAALPAGPLAAALPAATRLRVLAESGRERGAEAVFALLDLLAELRDASGRRLVLLLDEATEIRSLAYFKGLRQVHEPFGQALARRGAGVVLATSFPTLAARLWPALESMGVPAFEEPEVRTAFPDLPPPAAAEALALTAGRPRYLRLLAPRLFAGEAPVLAWAAEMAPGGLLEQAARQTYETLLLRSRGYGMSKAVLQAVAAEEGLNLTALVARLGRTPGATRDYLQWLVDVDALRREGRRYVFVDPVIRAWVRAQGRPPAGLSALAAELAEAALAAEERPVTDPEPAGALAAPERPAARRDTLIEID